MSSFPSSLGISAVEYLVHVSDGHELQFAADLLWDVLDVPLILLRQEDRADTLPVGCEDFFLQPTDGEDIAA